MLKNILFLIVCVAIAALSFGFFRVFGEYAFIILSVIALLPSVAKGDKPKFGNKD